MKNSKFNPLFETIYSRFQNGNGFLAGDVVKLKSDYKNLECYKRLGENVKQRIEDMVKTGNNIRVGRLHNAEFSNSYGAMGGTDAPASLADCYEEVAPSFWRNLVTIPVECLETANPALDLPPVPANQKDKPRAYQKPLEVEKDKPNKGHEIDEQTKVAEKQTHVQKGDYNLATKNTKLDNANNYDDSKPSKVKGLEKAKELKESYEGLYERMLNEDIGTMSQSGPGMSDEGNQLAGNPQIQSEEESDEEKSDKEKIKKAQDQHTLTHGVDMSGLLEQGHSELPPPEQMEKMNDEEILSVFNKLGSSVGPENFAQAVYDYTKQVSPGLLQRIKDLSRRNQANKAGSAQ